MSYVSSQPAHHVTSAGVGQTDSSFHVSSILEQQQQALNAAIHAFDQVPAPSLREVLGAYRLKGDGDREMLLAILNAKAAEDQRLASMASLHQTILQIAHANTTLPPLSTASPDGGNILNAPPEGDRLTPPQGLQHSESPRAGTSGSSASSRAPVMSISSLTSPSHHAYPSPPQSRNNMEVDGDRASAYPHAMNPQAYAPPSVSASGPLSESSSSSHRLRSIHRRSPLGSTGADGRHSFERISSERSTS